VTTSPATAPGSTDWVLEGGAVATVDGSGTEHGAGHVVVQDGRITAVGPGPAPDGAVPAGARRVDTTGCLVTPGLVNTHHHFSQWLTRGMAADSDLFSWLQELYPVWALVDAEAEHAAALGSLLALVSSGCTTAMDHNYVFPSAGGDILAAEIEAARAVGVRFHPSRGSMDLGRSKGGLPPDEVVEDTDAALAATEEAVARWHDPSSDSMLRMTVAPCSPFSVTAELMRGAADLARRLGVRLHTHLAETVDESDYCAEHFGCSPTEYVGSLGWLGDDVWVAHGVHLDAAARSLLAEAGTGVAHCPSSNGRLGAGTAPIPELLAAGVAVGLGVDGSASNEAGLLGPEMRAAMLHGRARSGPTAVGTRQALWMATMGGARCLGRHEEIGSLEPGKLADVAVWRIDTAAHAGMSDPVAALTLGSLPPLDLLMVGGRPLVEGDEVVTVDPAAVARQVASACRSLNERGARLR
jgi:cytosine/adenosine deaminase-related metal-dependent hydrolase